MIKSTKGQGISLNVIIIAIVALVVLIILIAIFTGRIGKVGSELDETAKGATCDSAGGSWKQPTECSNIIYGKFSDYSEHPGQVCCKRQAS